MVPKIRKKHTHHRTKRWASHSTWAGPPVPRRRARAGAPLLGFGGSMWASLHNTTTQPKHASRSWVGLWFVLCGGWHVCLCGAGRPLPVRPTFPTHSTHVTGRAALADPAPSHPAQSALGPPLTHTTTYSTQLSLSYLDLAHALFTYSFHCSSSFDFRFPYTPGS